MNTPPRVAGTPVEEVLRRLELEVSRRLDGLLQGDYRGLVPGHGSEPGDARGYVEGDDVRRIDWNVTARMAATHVRDTVADRELEAWLLVDRSASLDFGTAACEKRDLALAAAAAVGFATLREGNRVGAVVAEGNGTRTIPARSGRANLLALLRRLGAGETAEGAADLEDAIRRLAATATRRGLAVVVSDFLAPEGWERPLRALGGRHDVLAIEVLDPRELELPSVGVLDLIDPETGRRREVQTSSPKLQARYAEAAGRQRENIGRAIRSAGADHLVLRTDRDWLLALVRFVTLRRARIQTIRRAAP